MPQYKVPQNIDLEDTVKVLTGQGITSSTPSSGLYGARVGHLTREEF